MQLLALQLGTPKPVRSTGDAVAADEIVKKLCRQHSRPPKSSNYHYGREIRLFTLPTPVNVKKTTDAMDANGTARS